MKLSTMTTTQKWVAFGLIVLVGSAMNQSQNENQGRYGQPSYGYAPAQQMSYNGGPQPRYSDEGGDYGSRYNQEQPRQGEYSGYAPVQGGNGGYAPSGGASEGADVTSGYWARQESQDRTNHAFDQYINDTTTVRETGTGTVYNDVSNDIANPAVESGGYTPVPTAELPTSYSSSAPETPASE